MSGLHSASSAAAPGASISERLAAVGAAIGKSARFAGRRPEEVTLIAISKARPVGAIRQLLDAGHRVFGENRVQEAQAKWPALQTEFPDARLHLVGQLQTNKAVDAVALFDAIHAVDRPALVAAVAAAIAKLGRRPDCFVQVNIGDEPQKGGCPVADLPALLQAARDAALPLAGLMCIPPGGIEPAPYFALLAKLARRHGLSGLSMGMSADYDISITLGATHVRVGTALFGGSA